MSNESRPILNNYTEVLSFVAQKIGVTGSDNDYQYYPFSRDDTSRGFLELIFPVTDSSGRLLRGAAGNGPIFIFLYSRGTWTFLGEMEGTKVTPDTLNETIQFRTYSHVSAISGIERQYEFRHSEYVCV